MKSIETVYKGYRFRSRTEARWAVFFDALGIKWEYEHEGFQRVEEDGTRYLPDIWLPDWGVVVEVKPDMGVLSPTDRNKVESLAYLGGGGRGVPVLVAFGAPGGPTTLFFREFADSGCGDLELPCAVWWTAPRIFVDDASVRCGADHGVANLNAPLSRIRIGGLDAQRERCNARAEDAINAARSARFEFGESGVGR